MSKQNFEFLEALQLIAREKNIGVDILLDALADALVAAYKRMPNTAEEAVVTVDPDTGEIRSTGRISTRTATSLVSGTTLPTTSAASRRRRPSRAIR